MRYDTEEFEERLKRMRVDKQLAFGSCLAERALPMYLAFQADTTHIGSSEVLAAYASIWRALETGQWETACFLETSDCEIMMPDSEDYHSFYTSAAMDAVALLCSLLDFITHRDTTSIAEAIRLQIDTIDLAAQRLIGEYDVDENDALVSGPTSMLSQERSRMYSDLDFLESIDGDSVKIAIAVRSRICMLDYRSTRLIRLP